MGRLTPREEQRMAHSYHNYAAIGLLGLSIALLFLSYAAYDHRRYSVHVMAQNFGWVFDVAISAWRTWDVSIDEVDYRHWDGDYEFSQLAYGKYTPEQTQRVLDDQWARYKYEAFINDPEGNRHRTPKPMNPGSYATFQKRNYQIAFGQTDWARCNYSPGGRPQGLPSILRTMELSCAAQLFVRIMVLGSFYIRWYYTYLRSRQVLNTKTGCLIRCLAHLTPKLQFIEGVFAFLISALQQDNDRPLLFLFPYVIIGWAVAICAYILVFTLMSLVDGAGESSSSRLAQIRLGCLSVCIFASPIWITHHLPFIKWKTCFAEVPVREAMAEYVTIAAVIVFVFTQLYEVRNYWGLLSCSDHDYCVELNPEFESSYRPAEVQTRPASTRNRLTSSASRKKSSSIFLMNAMVC